MARLRMRMDRSLFSESRLETLFQQSLEVWRGVPFRVQGTEAFYELLSDYGCAINGEQVTFPRPVRDKVLARIADEKTARAEADADASDWPESEVRMYTHGQGLHICDLETNTHRPATEEDLAQWSHAVDALGDVGRTHPTFIPTDVPTNSGDFHAFATILLNSRQPHRVSVYSTRMLPFFIEACRIAKGSMHEVKRDPVFATKCWVNSPFMLTRENIEVAMEARRLLGTPIEFGHMPVAGGAGPVTIAGSLVQNTAESLALCAMRLAVDDLTHGITPTSSMIDMKHASHRQSGPDLALHILAGSEMGAYLFGGSPRIVLMGVGAQTVSAQSVYEKALAAAFNTAAGLRTLGIGCLAYSDVGSPVQLVLDYEMGLYFRHLFREVAVDDEHVGMDTLLSTAPRGAFFLETDHTAHYFREETWIPAFMDHRVPLAWAANPSDMIVKARARARDLFANAENRCPLSEGQRQEIRKLVNEADAAVRG